MTIKHTPGPWRIGATPPNGEQTIGTRQGLMVAVATTGIALNETLANARLIAAAPDLLEALKLVVQDDEEWAASDMACDLDESKLPWLAPARAVIAQAQGHKQ